jgi:hypothetical protein
LRQAEDIDQARADVGSQVDALCRAQPRVALDDDALRRLRV